MKTRNPIGALACLAVASIALTSCSTVSVRKDSRALFREALDSAEALEEAGVEPDATDLLRTAKKQEALGNRERAAAAYLGAAVRARAELLAGASGTVEAELIDLHNQTLARFAELWSHDPQRKTEIVLRYGHFEERYEISAAANSDVDHSYFDHVVAAAGIKGEGVIDKHREGYGAPVVAVREQRPERESEMRFFPQRGLHVPVTLVISEVGPASTTEARSVSISLLDPTKRETVSLGGRTRPLAADFSAPIELLLAGQNEVLRGLGGFLNARKREQQAGIYLLEPYDPERIPVVLTHGLISVPIIWRDIVPEFLSEPDIAREYQFFVFTYPTSLPVAESSLLMRQEIADLRSTYDPDGKDPLSRNMVAMGHSMGGILTHLLVAEMGDHYWKQFSSTPIDEIEVTEENRERMRELTYFDSDRAVNRAVFLSTPHYGAEMATASLAGAVSRLAKLPSDILVASSNIANAALSPDWNYDLRKKATSVQSLRPDSPVSMALREAPYRSGVVYHSIIGDQGLGDTPDSSDGVVAYWSSHQPGAASELIVPTDHSSYKHPDAIAELKRILRLHAGLNR